MCFLGDHPIQVFKAPVSARRKRLVVPFTVMAQNTVKRFETQVPPRAIPFDALQKLDALDIVQKMTDAVCDAQFGKIAFPLVPEWGMADVVSKRDGFDEVLVQAKKSSDGSGNSGNELHMEHPVGDVVVFDEIEYLGFVDVAGIGMGMEDPIDIDGIGLPIVGIQPLFSLSPYGPITVGGQRAEIFVLHAIQLFPNLQGYGGIK
jgi:hypothetical protein